MKRTFRLIVPLSLTVLVFGFTTKSISEENAALIFKSLQRIPATFVSVDSKTGGISISSGKAMTDEILSKAHAVPNIVTLSLLESPVSDQAVIGILRASPKLCTLILQGSKVTDVTMRELRRVPSLQYLNVSHTNVSDESISQIVAMRTLKELVIQGTAITESGAKRISTARPEMVVDFIPR